MTKLITTLLASTAVLAGSAYADNHGETMTKEMKAKDTKMSAPEIVVETTTFYVTPREVPAMKAAQAFFAIDEEDNGLITRKEWADWQDRQAKDTMLFDMHDVDNDGDIELSEYIATTS